MTLADNLYTMSERHTHYSLDTERNLKNKILFMNISISLWSH